MTDMQVKAYANQLQAERNMIEQRSLEERKRSNLVVEAEKERSDRMNEALQQAADMAKYGLVNYMGPQYTQSGGGMTPGESPQGWWNIVGDLLEDVLNPVGAIFGHLSKIK